MIRSVRNIVNGIRRSRIIATNFGSFSAPSSKVTKTIFRVVGTRLTTGSVAPPVRTGLTAGGGGGGASSGTPHLRKAAARRAASVCPGAPSPAAAVRLADGAPEGVPDGAGAGDDAQPPRTS